MFTNDDLLEMQADMLLREAGALGRRTGVYTEKQLRRHVHREVIDGDMALRIADRAGAELEEMVISDLHHLGRLAGLTDNQQDAWDLRILGLTIEEIAAACDITRQAAYDRLNRARFRVIKAMVAYPYFGMWEVYYQLVHRWVGKRR